MNRMLKWYLASFAGMIGAMAEDMMLSPADKTFIEKNSEEEIRKEYELVKNKKSDLSKRERDLVVWFVERLDKRGVKNNGE
jgi:hypothetical protein